MPFYMFNRADHIEESCGTSIGCSRRILRRVSRAPAGQRPFDQRRRTWRRQRGMAQPAFQARQVQQYAATMVEYTRGVMSSWQAGQTYDIHQEMMRLTSQIVTKTLFDADMNDAEGSIGRDLEVAMNFYANPLAMWPAWRHVPTPTNLRFRRTLRRLNEVVFRLIEERRATGTEGRNDLLSRLLVAEDEVGRKMTDRELAIN